MKKKKKQQQKHCQEKQKEKEIKIKAEQLKQAYAEQLMKVQEERERINEATRQQDKKQQEELQAALEREKEIEAEKKRRGAIQCTSFIYVFVCWLLNVIYHYFSCYRRQGENRHSLTSLCALLAGQASPTKHEGSREAEQIEYGQEEAAQARGG